MHQWEDAVGFEDDVLSEVWDEVHGGHYSAKTTHKQPTGTVNTRYPSYLLHHYFVVAYAVLA